MKRNPRVGSKAAWILLTLLAGMLPAAADSTPATPATHGDLPSATAWTAVAASGSVQARTAGDENTVWQDVSRGDALLSATWVKTGRKGRATLTRASSLLLVSPHSEVELPADGYSEMETSVIQTSGSVLYKVDGRANPHFEVVTPYLVAGVKGTSFLVTVNERYASVTVQNGLVEISNPDTGELFDLSPGESAIRHRDEVGMELVHDQRLSREARREAKTLDRMDRDAASDPRSDKWVALDVDLENRKNSDVLFQADPFGDSDAISMHELDKELLEEMIGEGVHDGSLRAPGDTDLGVLPHDPADGSNGPGTPPNTGEPPVQLPPPNGSN